MHSAPVIFDLDGTLIDSLQDLAHALNATLEHLHCTQHPVDSVRTMIGGGARKLIERGLGPSNGHRVEEALAHFQVEYRAHLLDHTRLYPGVEEVLARLHAEGRTWSIATNKPAAFTAAIIEGLDLYRLGLASWAAGDEVSNKKPAADLLVLAAERGGFASTDRSAITLVGDMPVDVEAGRQFGCDTVGVSWGFDPEGVRVAQPYAIVDDAGGLMEVLRRRKRSETDKHQVETRGGDSVQS